IGLVSVPQPNAAATVLEPVCSPPAQLPVHSGVFQPPRPAAQRLPGACSLQPVLLSGRRSSAPLPSGPPAIPSSALRALPAQPGSSPSAPAFGVAPLPIPSPNAPAPVYSAPTGGNALTASALPAT